MKKLIAGLMCTAVSFGLAAQDSETPESRRNEFYVKPIGLFNFSGLQLEYKRSLKNRKYWTFGIDDLRVNFSKDLSPAPNTTRYNNFYNVTISTGCEKRRTIIGALDFISGPNVYLGYINSKQETTTTDFFTGDKTVSANLNHIYSVGPGYKLGILYTIKERLLVGGQFIPTLAVQYDRIYNRQTPGPSPTNSSDRLGLNFSLFNNSRLLIGYKF